MNDSTAAVKPKAKFKGNKKDEKDKNPKGKVAKGKGKEVMLNYAKFEGQGLSYKAKLFGFVEVPGPRGDQSSVQAIQKLKQQAKQLKKGANEHKLKITFNITLQGVRLFNEKTQTIEHEHPIHKISFISHDPEDRHVFGYIYSPPRSAANEPRKYYLFAIKSDKYADVITVQLYELFQVVYKMQENKKSQGKDRAGSKQRKHVESSQPLEPLQDKMLLEMSNKIGGDQQQYPPDEHLYAEPTFAKRTPSEPLPDYAVPHQEDEISEKEREHIATAIALSLSMQENSQPFSDSVSSPTAYNDSGFEAVFDSTPSFHTEENSNQNTFNAEFPPFENGLRNPENVTSHQGFLESSNDSEKNSMPPADETQLSPSNEISFNAFGDLSSNTDVKADFETSQNIDSSIDDEVRSSSDPSGEATSYSTKTEDMNSNSVKVEIQTEEETVEDLPFANPTTADSSSFESEQQNNDANKVETETSSLSETNKTVTRTSFEVNFETENEDEISSKQARQDVFSFEPSSDAFPSIDPFASTDTTEFDQSAFNAFGDDDPFSPKGATNVDSNSDPFADCDNPFTADFGEVSTNDFDEPKAVTASSANPFGENDSLFSADFSNANKSDFEQPNVATPDTTNSEDDAKSNKEDDIFEAMFEAKMEEQFESEISNKDVESNPENEVELALEKSSNDINVELGDKNKEITRTTEESQASMTLSNEEKTEAVEVEVLNDSPIVNNTITEQEETENSNDNSVNTGNTFDFSSNDVYVLLKTAAPANNTPLSPTEFSPPPLPPRPVIRQETIDTVVGPKVPPALPPRPTLNQPPSHEETTIRKPPELPPRLDLEENSLVESELVDTEQELNAESSVNRPASPIFQANYDTFDFDHIENNSSVGNVGTPPGFDSGDPFKDPFAGADPFQTPIAGDPFASSTSFDQTVQQDRDDFDPFSGDDPFAMSPAFDPQASFGSPFNTNLTSSNETNEDEQKDEFADFSTAFT